MLTGKGGNDLSEHGESITMACSKSMPGRWNWECGAPASGDVQKKFKRLKEYSTRAISACHPTTL